MSEQYISKIKDEELEINFYSVPQIGQVVGVSSAVRVTYLPTGDFAISMEERSTRTNIQRAKKDLEEILERKGLI